MNINKIEINKILYALYVCTNNDNEIINLEEIKTLLLLVFNSIDQKIENKELLINELKRKLNTYGFYQDNEPIIFKIGDLWLWMTRRLEPRFAKLHGIKRR